MQMNSLILFIVGLALVSIVTCSPTETTLNGNHEFLKEGLEASKEAQNVQEEARNATSLQDSIPTFIEIGTPGNSTEVINASITNITELVYWGTRMIAESVMLGPLYRNITSRVNTMMGNVTLWANGKRHSFDFSFGTASWNYLTSYLTWLIDTGSNNWENIKTGYSYIYSKVEESKNTTST